MNLGVLFIWSFMLGSMTTSLFIVNSRLLDLKSELRAIRQELEWARQTKAGL